MDKKQIPDYTAVVPVKEPEGLIPWLRSIGQLRGNILGGKLKQLEEI